MFINLYDPHKAFRLNKIIKKNVELKLVPSLVTVKHDEERKKEKNKYFSHFFCCRFILLQRVFALDSKVNRFFSFIQSYGISIIGFCLHFSASEEVQPKSRTNF